ncbi:MAG: glycosyltransferase [Hyphomonadaceae bacterium]
MAAKPLKISIVMPTKNAAAFVGTALSSVVNQTWRNRQLVLIDGGSADATLEIARRSLTEADILHVQADRSATEAVNRGVAMSDGDIICLLMSDDWLDHATLESFATTFAADPKADLVCGVAKQWLDEGGLPVLENTILPVEGKALDWSRLLGTPYMAAYAFRRRTWDAVGGFLPAYRYGADRDFLVRCRLQGLHANVASAAVYNYRRHAGSATLSEDEQVVRDFLGDHRLMASEWLRSPLLPEDERVVISAWRKGETVALIDRQVSRGSYSSVLHLLLKDALRYPSSSLKNARRVARHIVGRWKRRASPG